MWIGAAALLLLPALAMRFTSAMRWGVEDFAALAVLLLGTGVLVEGARRIRPAGLRIAALLAVLALAVLVWAMLATAD
ncbi:hypothetical protein PK98_12470 [Croceibacterium mercuriale]|uniref:Uncharacterized protein n=1 Tax=Croceibacterium mercuriale TaxID=1572751 RepID=A0A0B2BU90_9SPHN|nr:hypothetical protein PK98_12470 [Croceibacterium mercuriale]